MRNTVTSWFSNWPSPNTEALRKNLLVYRVIYVLYVFVAVLPRFLWIPHYPDTFFLPRIGITFFFSGFPGMAFFYGLILLLVLALLALLIGYKIVYSSLAVAMLLFVGNAWAYSFGKINHDIFLILIPLVLALMYWRQRFSTDKKNQPYAWPIPVFALIIGLAMMTAALAKITTGWLDPSTSALAGHLIKSYYVLEHETVFASYLLSFNNFYLFKFLDYSTLLLECAFIFCVFSQRYFRLVCATACLFHFGVQLTMEISFTPNVIAYAFFVNWSILYRMEPLKKGAQKLQSLSHEFGIIHLVILTLPIWTMYTQFRNPFTFDLGLRMFTGGTIAETLIMLAAVYISLKYIHHLLHDAIINSRLHPSKKEAKLYN